MELLSKLSNLTYEIFGVLLPGAFAPFLTSCFWYSLGGVAPGLTNGASPELTFTEALQLEEEIRQLLGPLGPLCVGLMASYFLGHALDELGRTRGQGLLPRPDASDGYGLRHDE